MKDNVSGESAAISVRPPKTGETRSEPHPEDFCEKCGRSNIVWFAPSELWNKYAGDKYGILCPVCFVQQAEDAGFKMVWQIAPEDLDAAQPAIQLEREACAKIAEAPYVGQAHTDFARGRMYAANEIAKAIRARNTEAV
ncbi:MAG: hypothetical protein LC729_00430 [Acidobacteria bacterium]|nr:hypothetical protein [Acidobacteriota bacterium]